MPIYAYKCESCGHAKDVLQKISDAPLTDCPQCSAPSFRKQVTAAGFQLKGSGWYVTDFRGGNTAGAPAAKPSDAAVPGAEGAAPAATTTPAPATAAAAPVAAAPATPAASSTGGAASVKPS